MGSGFSFPLCQLMDTTSRLVFPFPSGLKWLVGAVSWYKKDPFSLLPCLSPPFVLMPVAHTCKQHFSPLVNRMDKPPPPTSLLPAHICFSHKKYTSWVSSGQRGRNEL